MIQSYCFILAAGCDSLGRYYQEGEEWYPLVSSYRHKCIICTCKVLASFTAKTTIESITSDMSFILNPRTPRHTAVRYHVAILIATRNAVKSAKVSSLFFGNGWLQISQFLDWPRVIYWLLYDVISNLSSSAYNSTTNHQETYSVQ